MDQPTNDKESSGPHYWTTASYAVVILLIGLPLWWMTTTVHRVSLPYEEMSSLDDKFQSDFRIKLRVDLKGFADTKLTSYNPSRDDTISLKFALSQTSESEQRVLQHGEDLYEIDKILCSSSTADLTIYYVGREDIVQQYGEKIVLGNCRNLYYASASNHIDMERIQLLLRQFQDKEAVHDHKELPLSSGYDVLLTLLVPEPEVLDVHWEIEKAVKDYLTPLLEKLSDFADIKVRSQVLFYEKLNFRPKLNKASGVYEVSADQLPLVINPVETKLASFVSTNPTVNFLTNVAPCSQYPLQIRDKDGSNLTSNAFFVPQWGGIMIYNGPCGNYTTTVSHSISMTKVMSVVISQFRDLVGVPRLSSDTTVLNFRGSALRDWEVDLLLRHRLQRLVFTSTNTLKSLCNLLDQITNIVVTEEVGREVENSVQALKTAYSEASAGNLVAAQKQALLAYKSSEVAFHHPTNLAQLYFPDDQKYAIYIPLFLPVGIPVILSILSFVRKLKKNPGSTD